MFFKIFILFFSWIMSVNSQFSFSPIVGFQNITYPNGVDSSLIKDSGTNAYVNVIDNNYYYKVIHWNLTNSSNYYNAGNYTEITQSSSYYFTYLINGFVLASGSLDRVKVYNRSTYAYIGTLNTTDVFGRGQLITSNNIFVFATNFGSIGYFNASNIPNINIIYLTPPHNDFTFLELSPDQAYFVTSSINSNLIMFWSTSNWSLIRQATANTVGVYGHTWSPDSRYCYSNLYNQGKIQVYDRNLNFAKIYTIITNQLNVRTTFYYPQTNILVGLSQYSKSLFTVNMNNNITTHYVYNFSNTFKMYTDQEMKSFTVNDGITNAWFFKIYPYCNATAIYNKTTMICDSCPSNCSVCNSSTYCTTCNANFNNANGVCIQCTGATYFNSTNHACVSCSNNCSVCSNSTYCTTCSANFNNANGVCIQCTGATYFNSTNLACASCPINCSVCSNSTYCTTCSANFNNANGVCIQCTGATYFNSTNHACVSCSNNCSVCSNSTYCTTCSANFNNANGVCIQCTGATYFNSTNLACASCPINCSVCSNSTYCTTCSTNFNNANGVCIQCTGATYFNSTNLSCASCLSNCLLCNNSYSCTACSFGYNNAGNSCVMCLTNQYFNLSLLTCQSCQINCASCTNSSFCVSCQANYNNAGGTCILCQSNQYYNTSLLSCEVCSSSCIQCQNSSSCLVCQYNFILVNETCQLQWQNDNIDAFFQYVLSVTIQNEVIEYLNIIPGSRRILKQVFGFFINLDHFWLYIYHKREYGYYVNATLYTIKNLQDSKWNMISSQTLTKAFSLNISNLQNDFNSKTNYTSWKFMQVEKNQMNFFGNTLNYFILNVPLVLVIFLLMRFLFKIFFNFQISLLFRQYSFYAYLILMLVEGNIEDFLYLFVSELFTFFSFSFIDKMTQILMIGFFFFFIFSIFCSYLIFKSAFNKLTKYFYDNCHTIISGAAYLTITNGLFNFCLGSAHRIFQDSYKFQLLSLSIIQIFYMIFIVCSLKNYKIFEFYYIQWANFVESCLRILLLVTYFIDYKAPGEYYVIQQTQRSIIILYLLIWLLIIILNYCFLTVKFVQYLVRKYKKLQKQDNQKYKYRNMIGYPQNGNKKLVFQYISGQPQSKSQKKSLGIKIIIDDSMSDNATKIQQKQRIKQIIQKNKRDPLINKINSSKKQQQNIEINIKFTTVKAKRRLQKQKKTYINGLSLLKKQENQEFFQQVWNFSRTDKEKCMNHFQFIK